MAKEMRWGAREHDRRVHVSGSGASDEKKQGKTRDERTTIENRFSGMLTKKKPTEYFRGGIRNTFILFK
jgi:hypothetical protein